jgi:hypothetical protein
LVALTPDGSFDESNATQKSEVLAAIRMVCRTVAQQSQKELRFTSAETPDIPV